MTDTKTYICRINSYTTVEQCETFAKNAARKGRTDLVEAANRRALEIKVSNHNAQSMVEREVIEAIYRYESVNGRKATRTWQMVERHGFIETAARLAVKKNRTAGFRKLVAAGHRDMTFESIIVRHPEVFNPEVVVKAKAMLNEAF